MDPVRSSPNGFANQSYYLIKSNMATVSLTYVLLLLLLTGWMTFLENNWIVRPI